MSIPSTAPARLEDDHSTPAIVTTREFFAALEAGDIDRFLRVWADAGVQEMPFAPDGFPKRLDGKAAIDAQYRPLPAAFSSMLFPIRRLLPSGRSIVVAEFEGRIELKAGGRYDNRYVGVFEYDGDGRLARYTEYFDPLTLLAGFPGAAAAAEAPEAAIQRAVQRVAGTADARDWPALRALFADEVDVDYTSVAGGTPARMSGDTLVAGWRTGLGRYAATKHHFGDVRVTVDGDAAAAAFTGQATHAHASGERWSCGDYEYRFVRRGGAWLASAARFVMRWEQGSR